MAGKSDAAIEATRAVPCAADAPWTEHETVALRLTDAMTREITVSEGLFAQVQARFSVQEQVDLVATIAAYNMVSRFLTAFHIGH
jgi:alkylhydroperoxidase family enzyme